MISRIIKATVMGANPGGHRLSCGALLLTAMFLFISIGKAQVWEMASDFSVDKNPNGVWTFGWQEEPGREVHPYDLLWGTQKDAPIKGFWAPGWFGPVRAWCAVRSDTDTMLTRLPPPGEFPVSYTHLTLPTN